MCERRTCINGGISVEIQLTINDESTTVEVGSDDDLATVLRQNGYTGVKCGCDSGVCGASKVFVDDEVKMACDVDAQNVAGAEIETIEGLGTQDDLHPIQEAFVDHFAVQCGYCIPGMIIQATSLLADNSDPTETEVREAIDDNLCRCTGYQKPVEAILDAADRMRDDRSVAADGGSQITLGNADPDDHGGDTNE